jgi:hypothetical protein
LTVLVSYDVQFLKPVLRLVMRLPNVQRANKLISRLHSGNVAFLQSFPPVMAPSRLETLRGAEAAVFVKLFPNWERGRATPESVDACAVFFDPYLLRGDSWIYASSVIADPPDSNQPPLAGPIPAAALFDQLKKQVQNTVYTAGFLLMAFATILSLVYIAT